jgi:uncharacterized SAM-binding protein YcdF (DUF218 family)
MADSLTGRPRSGGRGRWSGWAALILVILALGIGWAARASILRGMADLWIISDSAEKADAVVVLGGGLDVRPFVAANLYKRGLTQQVLVANVRPSAAEALKILPGQAELTREILVRLGVPPTAIIRFGDGVSNTYEEARAILEWVRISGAKSLIIPIDIFSARRVRWIFRRELTPVGVRVAVHALTPHEYSLADWWQHEQGLIAFQNELIKFGYYRFKY